MNSSEHLMIARPVERQGFTIQDILWAIGIWSVILTMAPVIVFYLLMVA